MARDEGCSRRKGTSAGGVGEPGRVKDGGRNEGKEDEGKGRGRKIKNSTR